MLLEAFLIWDAPISKDAVYTMKCVGHIPGSGYFSKNTDLK